MTDGAFNQMATDYDDVFTNSKIGQLQREKVWGYLNKNIRFGDNFRVLELNCGTGEDASIFAQKGCRVTATDISSEMLNISRAKAEKLGVSAAIEFKTLDINNIEEYLFENKYDLVFSNFGGLNCVSEKSIRLLKSTLTSILKPDGRFIAVVMPTKCMMETIYFLLRFEVGKAFRRGKKQVEWKNNQGEVSMIHYYSPNEFRDSFKEVFEMKTLLPIGLWIPPSYTEQFFNRHGSILGALKSMEYVSKFSFLSSISDHYLIDFKLKN
jgi:ubiquinone/menaquinone biosynthesis C-methylase UbiE